MKKFGLLLVVILIAVAHYATGEQLDPSLIGGALEDSGVLGTLPAWAIAVIPPFVVTFCALVNAFVPDRVMGKLAPIVNKLALAFRHGANDPAANE